MTNNIKNNPAKLTQTWTLPPAATLGSSVRAKGILPEIRSRLPFPVRKSLDLSGRLLTLTMAEGSEADFEAASAIVAEALIGIESLPVIPREIEDILTITTSERRRCLEDGRLPSAGTRTVKLRGRAGQITFHVFEPRMVEDLLDRGVVEEWREEDAAAAAENRRRAALKAKLTRSLKSKDSRAASAPHKGSDAPSEGLTGWEEFDRDGLLH